MAAVMVVQRLALVVGYQLVKDGTDAAAGVEAHEQVVCPECETANEPVYRYCRACIAELPGGSVLTGDDNRPVGRLMR